MKKYSMKKMRRFTLILTLVLLMSSLFIPSASAFASARLLTNKYIVNSSASDADANPGNGICATTGGKCTLYAAIQEANADGVYSTINFAQKFQGTNHIDGCTLPAITVGGTTIDASSQWDTTYNRPGVEIIGSTCTLLTISAGNTKILGLLFGGSDNAGVKVSGSFNAIGDNNTGYRNVFTSGFVGVLVLGGTSNAIANNYFGTIDGTSSVGSATNGIGIMVQSGDYTTISNNLIVGQSYSGIELISNNNVVRDNIVGMSWNKSTALPNKVGIILAWGGGNTIGTGNVIAGNTSHGLHLYHSDNNDIQGNYIGYAGVGNGGDGIHLHVSDNNRITEGNTIANNAGNGIYAIASSDITIQGSYVDSNSQVGIYFDTCSNSLIGGSGTDQLNSIGGNHNLSAPVITSASCSQVKVTACANCLVEIYSDNDDEGRVYEGSLTMPGRWSVLPSTWNGTLHGPNVTALVIGPDSSMDTSPFSAPFAVGSCP